MMTSEMIHRVEPGTFNDEAGAFPGDEVIVQLVSGKKDSRMVFCWCPPGSFERLNDEKKQRVSLTRGFWLGKHPMSQRLYHLLTGENPSDFTLGENHPVDSVTWEDGKKVCKKLNRAMPGTWNWALPTEAQWEYACSSGRGLVDQFGIGNGRDLSSQMANFDGSSPDGEGMEWREREVTSEEGCFPPNDWGLHEMHGQLWEWCEDHHGEYREVDRLEDPVTRSGSSLRVLRGGSWFFRGRNCRSDIRYAHPPGNRNRLIGLRFAIVPTGKSAEGGVV